MSYGLYGHRRDIPARPDLTQRQADKPKSKREKHVFGSNDTGVHHVWANPLTKDGQGFYQTHGTNPQRNFYFKTDADGTRVLYSYRDTYPVASLFDIGKGKRKRIYLIRSGKSYSVTTSGHISAAYSAIPDKKNVFQVPYVTRHDNLDAAKYGNVWTRDGKPDKATHTANLADIVARCVESIEASNKARAVRNIVHNHTAAVLLQATAKRYARTFAIKLPKLPSIPVLDNAKLEAIRERERIADEKREAIRKAARAAYEAKHAEEVAQWEASGTCTHTPHHTFADQYDCKRQTEEDDWNANRVELIAAWKRGEDVKLRLAYNEPALLRVRCAGDSLDVVNPDSYVVETSQHVTVPVSGKLGAARLLRFLQSIKAEGRTYQRNGHTEHIGRFTVDSFGPLENDLAEDKFKHWILRAGCHHILWSEIESIIPQVIDAELAESGGPKNTPCGIPMRDIADFAEHVKTCLVCANKLDI
jgi:hypothetical protein